MSSHLIHKPLGADDIVQSLIEGNREAVMESCGGSHHLDWDGGKRGWRREPAFLGSLLMNPPGENLLQVSFCNSLVALKFNGIQQVWNFFFSLWSFILYEY